MCLWSSCDADCLTELPEEGTPAGSVLPRLFGVGVWDFGSWSSEVWHHQSLLLTLRSRVVSRHGTVEVFIVLVASATGA